MTKRQRLIILFFITKSLFLGIGISSIMTKTRQDSWIAMILGFFIGLLILIVNQNILNKKKDKKINIVLKEMGFLGIIIRILLFLFGCLIFLEALIIIQTYATSFFLINTPFLAINIPIIFLIYLICRKGIATIGRVAECLFPISLILFFISVVCLFPYVELDNFLPILESSPLIIIKTAIYIGAISATPSILMLEVNDDGKKMLKTYIFTMVILFLVVVFIMGDLGAALSESFRFPEYIVLKKIQIFNFIEKIENILSIQWILDILITLSFSGFFIKKMLPEKRNNVTFILTLGLLLFLSAVVFGKEYNLILYLKEYCSYIFIGFLLLTSVFILIYLSKRNNKFVKK